MNHRFGLTCTWFVGGLSIATLVLAACGGEPGADGAARGKKEPLCKVEDADEGSKLITCDDGSQAVISDGSDGKDGADCSVRDNGDGTKTISCDDGTSATVRDGLDNDGKDGNDGDEGKSGKNGDDGIDGFELLSSVADASALACPNGGSHVRVGLDDGEGDGTARDGKLHEDEVDDEFDICGGPQTGALPTVVEGSVSVESSLDLVALRDVTEVTGVFSIGDGLTAISLPNLTTVGGNVVIGATTLVSLDLSGLTNVGGALLFQSQVPYDDLTALDLSGLTTVGDNLYIYNMPNLTTLDLGHLTTVGGEFLLSGLGVANLDSLSMLTSATTVAIRKNTSLLDISGLDNIASLGLSCTLDISGNTLLPNCIAQVLADQIESATGCPGWTISMNNSVCPP